MTRRLKDYLFLLLAFFALAAIHLGCDDAEEDECTVNDDCGAGSRCVLGTCEPMGTGDGQNETSENCASGVTPVGGGDLRINEVFSAPTAGAHDLNCDGNPSSTQDEFIEIVNNSDSVLNLIGVQVMVNDKAKHTLDTCLDPGKGIVVFSGGSFECDGWGSTQAVISSTSLSLANTGTFVSLDLAGETLDSVAVPSLSGVSYTRVPDFTGSDNSFAKHNEVSALDQSAGLCIGGAELAKGCTGGTVMEGEDGYDGDGYVEVIPACDIPPEIGDILINEVHNAPDTALDDSNCDGAPSSTQDEYVELVNVADHTVALSGLSVQVNGTEKHVFGGVCLEPNRGIILYAGGTASCSDLGETQAFVSDKSLSLANTGTNVSLVYNEVTMDQLAVPAASSSKASYTRSPDFTGDFAFHDEISPLRNSPGKCISGAALTPECPAPPACDDLEQNGDETDVDCGGSCDPCVAGQSCLANEDCVSGTCEGDLCAAAPGCNDNIQNNDETDVDCGGSCDPCALTQACLIDEDCLSGLCAAGFCSEPLPPPAAGMVIFTEAMPDPSVASDADGEWIELYNTSATDSYSLKDCVLTGGSRNLTFEEDLVIGPNAYITVAGDAPGFTADLMWSSMSLTNSGVDLSLNCDELVDAVSLGSATAGASFALDSGSLTATGNDDSANWCTDASGSVDYNSGDMGSPNAANGTCP